MLDLGCGGGDVITHLARRAERDGLEVEWVGVDPDPRAIEVAARAAARRRACGSSRTDSSELLAAGERFDLVLSNHVLHHLDATSSTGSPTSRGALSRGLVLHGDIERGRIAYGAVRRRRHAVRAGHVPAHRRAALDPPQLPRATSSRAVLGPPWRVETPGSFRVLATAPGTADA